MSGPTRAQLQSDLAEANANIAEMADRALRKQAAAEEREKALRAEILAGMDRITGLQSSLFAAEKRERELKAALANLGPVLARLS